MTTFWRIVNDVIRDADVLLLLLDARLIEETRNEEIENKIKQRNKSLIYVISKCDLVDKKKLEEYKKQIKPCVFVSAKEYFGITMLRERIFIEAKRHGITKRMIKVGVLGYPNVGKSSLINSFKGKKSAKTSLISGCTRSLQKVKADNRIILLDTPGVLPYDENDFMKHAAIGTLSFIRVKEPDIVVMDLMEKFPGKIEKYYKIKIKEDKEETIEDIAMKKNILKKGGIPDIIRASREIIKDWQKGSIGE